MQKVNLSAPNLRFPGFSNDWKKRTLGEICEVIGDGTHFSPKLVTDGPRKYITSKNIKDGYLDITEVAYISETSHQKIYKSSPVKSGDILLTKDGASTGNLCVNTLTEDFSLLSSVAFIRANGTDSTNSYIYQYLRSPTGQREITSSIAGQAITRITLTKLSKFRVALPSLSEQKKIADLLLAVDEKVVLLNKKISLLNQYKSASILRIFTQQVRFKRDDGLDFPDWLQKKLSDVFIGLKGSGLSLDQVTADGRYKCILYGELYTRYTERVDQVHSRTNINNGVLSAGNDLLLPCSTTTTGIDLANATALNEKGILLGGDISILRFKETGSNIFYAYYLTHFIKNRLAAYGQGSTIVHMYFSHYKKLPIMEPCVDEQRKIASFLTKLDERIKSTENKVVMCKKLRRSLLQKLFI